MREATSAPRREHPVFFFNGVKATTITSWSATRIICSVPTGAETGNVFMVVSGFSSNVKTFTVEPVVSNNGAAVWQQYDTSEGESRRHVYSRNYLAGTGWENLGSAATRLDDDLATEVGNSGRPQISFDSSGNAIAVWYQYDDSEGADRYHIYARRYVAGTGWENLGSTATRLDDDLATESGNSLYPKIAFDSSGNAIAVWEQSDDSEGEDRYHIYARRYVAGTGWENLGSVATRLDDDLATEVGSSRRPQIAFDSSGNAMAIWYQQDDSEVAIRNHIYARRYVAGTGWENLGSTATRLDDDLATESGSSTYPEIALDSSGNAIAIWQQNDTSEVASREHIYARRYVAGTGWENLGSAATRLDDDLATESGNSYLPKIAMDSSGNAIAVWYQYDTSEVASRTHIYARRYVAGTGWENLGSTATRLDDDLTTESGISQYPEIAFPK
ncbi:MAG: hypothetical protein ABIH39_01810 [Candidatus Margulisiibacteriota bacterium]